VWVLIRFDVTRNVKANTIFWRKAMNSIFDDEMSAEELAIALGFAEEISEEVWDLRCSSQEDELLVPDEDAPEWYEED
jgi:hypothetical protein